MHEDNGGLYAWRNVCFHFEGAYRKEIILKINMLSLGAREIDRPVVRFEIPPQVVGHTLANASVDKVHSV